MEQRMNYKDYVSDASLTFGLLDRSGGDTFAENRDLMLQLSHFYKKMKSDQRNAASIYQPGGEWAVYVEERREFYDCLLTGDLEGVYKKLKYFWRNELGPIVSNYAYYPDLASKNSAKIDRFISLMSRDYVIWRSIHENESFDVLSVPDIGNPWGYAIENNLIIPQAFRFHNHAKQISNILSDIETPIWAEIGGGYGGTAFYYFRNNYAPKLTYLDFDLPETLVIAAYYLITALPDKKIWLYDGRASLTNAAMAKYDIVLMPNFAIEYMEDEAVDLFLNAFSLSEMTFPILSNYISHIQRTLTGYFLHNNMDKKGIVNRGFERTPCSHYPIDPERLKLLYKKHDMFQGYEGDYRECLYQRTKKKL